jgi:hypothetical protein
MKEEISEFLKEYSSRKHSRKSDIETRQLDQRIIPDEVR